MKTELIKVIEKTIDVLENNKVEYRFMQANRCNCGILAQQACGIDADSLNDMIGRYSGNWQNDVTSCPMTGEKLSIVWQKLEEIGLSKQDMRELEALSNLRIRSRAGGLGLCSHKPSVIKYLKAWRDLLIEESQPEVKTEYKLVFSDQKVKQLVNEKLILS